MGFDESCTREQGRCQENYTGLGPGFFRVLVFVERMVACFACVVYNLGSWLYLSLQREFDDGENQGTD